MYVKFVFKYIAAPRKARKCDISGSNHCSSMINILHGNGADTEQWRTQNVFI